MKRAVVYRLRTVINREVNGKLRLIARMREASFAALISIIACFWAAIMEITLPMDARGASGIRYVSVFVVKFPMSFTVLFRMVEPTTSRMQNGMSENV